MLRVNDVTPFGVNGVILCTNDVLLRRNEVAPTVQTHATREMLHFVQIYAIINSGGDDK